MTQPSREHARPSPNAERLRAALGWERLPEMTAEECEAFNAELRRHDEEVRRFYGKPAA